MIYVVTGRFLTIACERHSLRLVIILGIRVQRATSPVEMSARGAHALKLVLKSNIPSQQGCGDLLECQRKLLAVTRHLGVRTLEVHVAAYTKLVIFQQHPCHIRHGEARMYLAETREQPIDVLSADDLEQIFHAEEGDLATRQRELADGPWPSVGSAPTVRGTNVTMGQVDAPRTGISYRGASAVYHETRGADERTRIDPALRSLRRARATASRYRKVESQHVCSSSAWTVPHDDTISASSATCSP